MKSILILGATGSIGASACDVVRTHPRDFCVAGIAVRSSRERAEALGREFNAPVFVGEDAALRAVKETEADLVLVSTVGLSGLAPTLAAIEKGENVALATKEVMVAAGELVCKRAEAKGVKILPVDSEHSAIFQCIEGAGATEWRGRRDVAKLVLTASGGPFLDGPDDLSAVTPAQALNHPRWKMGPKVTVDSSTMMNKGFEILEARWLFDIPVDRIDVVVHPESIVHSLVEFVDGATLAQLSPPDMRVPIQLALSYPVRLESSFPRLDWWQMKDLTFERPDEDKFRCLKMAYEAIRIGGNAACIVNAANEVVNLAFRQERCGFLQMADVIEKTLQTVAHQEQSTLEDYLACDAESRRVAASLI